MERKRIWENWVNLLLGAWVFIIPWVLTQELTDLVMSGSTWNFWIVGAIIFAVATLALQEIRPWEEWTNLIAGVWLIISPWIFGYADQPTLLWNSLVVGLLVAVLSGMALPIANKHMAQIS